MGVTLFALQICVNDDLVAKKFACFLNEKSLGNLSGCDNHSPRSLGFFSSPQHSLKTNNVSTVRSASSSHLVPSKSEENGFMPRKCYFPGQAPVNPSVLLFVYFMALCVTCSEIHDVKSQATAKKSVVPTGEVSAVSSSVLV